MATRSFSSTLIALSLLALTACQTPARKPTPVGSRPDIAPVPTSKDIEDVPQIPQQQPPPERHEPKRVAVILGPGGAKAFAHLGVLKELQRQRIPVEKVVGLEWGALIGGLYSIKGQTHDVDWKLYKMEQQNPLEPKGFFSRRGDEQPISIMDGFIKDAFGAEDISRARVKFACPTRSLMTGVVQWQTRGPFRDAVKRCMLYPPIFKAQGTFIAGASQATEAVEMLVKEGYNVILLVNVLGSAMPMGQESLRENLNYAILWQEIKRAISETSRLNIDTITVDTSAYPMNQFTAKKELISLGESATQKAAGDLIRKYGF